ncbi:uncharacterized protein M421DRAFT_423224 [Didymella exigua CBS 183.55]|uniref:Uncharacterized protein n=1 Tax=Didymella exigua CBS 183.55 TaxID=1150837 RepID=A0A6A5REL2_9PLEO|nr:uncharacterized protein M421DRAFT_423224 [Didymella exigua CBS 183.55]KAF1925943.1 hypothetical protein M421DRAFT_423224 [Didymella exigua CBS 183.55]
MHSSIAQRAPIISLSDLLEYVKVLIPNYHKAGNEVAGTLIAAVLTCLRNDIYMHGVPYAVVVNCDNQDVIEHFQALGKSLPPLSWGQLKLCTKCDRNNHVRSEYCAQVLCNTCENLGAMKLFKARKTHHMAKCLYDWNDELSLKLPKNVTAGMKRGYSTLIDEDFILPVKGASLLPAMWDMQMMALLSVMERTER